MVVITGDAHGFWINDLTQKDGTKLGVEIGTTSVSTTSVSSETLAVFLGKNTADYALLMTEKIPIHAITTHSTEAVSIWNSNRTGRPSNPSLLITS